MLGGSTTGAYGVAYAPEEVIAAAGGKQAALRKCKAKRSKRAKKR